MDKRQLSARAEMSGAAPSIRSAGAVSFLDRAIDLSKANWEVLFYVALMVIAVLTRFWDLGPRTLHHDESIHAYYSNQLLKGGGYNYDPVYHGPFLYHIVGLGFLLFGSTDAMVRVMPAVFGVIIIGLCWFLRPFIGRVGTMIAVLLVALSPSISYYSRSLRHDVFAMAGFMALFVGILWFMRTHQARWVFLGAVGLTVAYTSHELTFILALVFVLGLIAVAFLFPAFAGRSASYTRNRRGDEDVNPVTGALQALFKQKWTLIGAVLVFFAIYMVVFTNVFTKFGASSGGAFPEWLAGAPQFFQGLIGGLIHWASEHGVQRGNQPQYYYILMMLIYEPLAFFAGIGTIIYLIVKAISGTPDRYSPNDEADADVKDTSDQYGVALPSILSMRGLTLGFLAFWSIGAFLSFSLAGERMPWLTMHSALPFTLLASAGLGHLITTVNWREAFKGGGAFLGAAVLLFFFAAFAFLKFLDPNSPHVGGFQDTLQGVLLFLFTVGLLALCGWIAYKIMPGKAVAVVGMTFAVVLALYGLRSMMLVNYRHGDVPIEMLVYTQSAPDVPIVADMIKRLSRDETAFDAGRSPQDVTGGRSLQIGVDSNVEWPFDWYFRDMRALNYYPTNDPNNYYWDKPTTGPMPPVLIVSDDTVNKTPFQDAVKDKYVSEKYPLRWWFPEDLYKDGDKGNFGKAWDWMSGKTANGGPSFLRYLLYRDPGMPLGSTNFNLYVRNDLAVKIGMPGTTLTVSGETETPNATDTGQVYNMFEMAPAGNGKGQFNAPRAIAQDSNGNFFVVDTQNLRVQKFDSTGKFLATFGSRGDQNGQFNPINDEANGTGPSGIAVDKSGNVYVADTWNHRVQKFDNTGKFLTKWGGFINIGDPNSAGDSGKDAKFYGPRGIAVGPDDKVYVTDTGNKRVLIFDTNGRFLRKIDSGMSPNKVSPNYPFNQAGELHEPIGVAVDGTGNVYVADTNNRRIQKFDNTGKFAAQWPISGSNWEGGSYLEPFVATDSTGNVYVSAPTGKTILKFSPTGQALGQKNKEGSVTLKTPTGVMVVADGTIYVVDTSGNGVVNLGKMP